MALRLAAEGLASCSSVPAIGVWFHGESIMPESAGPDHDQRLKVLLKEFFEAFFLCFFPAWAARFEFLEIDWLDKEVFLAPPQGERRQLDLVARLPAAARRAAAPRGRGRPGGVGPRRARVASQHPGLPAADVRLLHPTAARHRAAGAAHRACSCASGSTASAGTPTKNISGNSGSSASSTPTSVCRPWTASRTRRARTCWVWR